MAAILKRAVDDALRPHLASDQAKHESSEREGFERGKLASARELERYQKLEQQWKEFERRSGITITQYTDVARLGDAAHVVMHGGDRLSGVAAKLQFALNDARSTVAALEQHIEWLAERRKGEGCATGQEAASTSAAGEVAF